MSRLMEMQAKERKRKSMFGASAEEQAKQDEETARKKGWAERQAQQRRDLVERYARFDQQISARRQRQIDEQRRLIQEVDLETIDTAIRGALEIIGAIPPITADRVEPNPGEIIHLEKSAALGIIKADKEKEPDRIQ